MTFNYANSITLLNSVTESYQLDIAKESSVIVITIVSIPTSATWIYIEWVFLLHCLCFKHKFLNQFFFLAQFYANHFLKVLILIPK